MAGFLDNIDNTSEVKYTENYKPVSKSTTMRVDTDIKKRLNQMALDKDTSIKAIVDEVLGEFLEKKISISILYIERVCHYSLK
jgi:predicted HicB family RNase H-like nuclease